MTTGLCLVIYPAVKIFAILVKHTKIQNADSRHYVFYVLFGLAKPFCDLSVIPA